MKKLMLIVGVLAAANILIAQDQRPTRERAKVKIEEVKERLELSDEQVEGWKAMKEKYKPQLKEIRDDQDKTRSEKLRALADVEEEREEDLAAILSEDQMAELKVIREEQKEKRAERRKGRRGRD